MDAFFHRVMGAGARLIFWLAMALLVVQFFNAVVALGVVVQASSQEFGPQIPYFTVIGKLAEAFVWPALLLALAMVVDRLDGREGGRK